PIDSQKPMLPDTVTASIRQTLLAMARYPEFAGWGIHFALNMHNVNGHFFLDDLIPELFEHVPSACPGVITAVLTYDIPRPWVRSFRAYLSSGVNRRAMLD